MRPISSREYKLMLDHRLFNKPKSAVAEFWREVKSFLRSSGVSTEGKFNAVKRRKIIFLDTPDFSVRKNGLILRMRVDQSGASQYTLKCRTADRYIANGIDLREAKNLKGSDKFEEDIGLPFVSRFSHSNTVCFKSSNDNECPTRIKEAAKLFPCLLDLQCDGRRCRPKTRLHPVNNVKAFERVFVGPSLVLKNGRKSATAEVALLLWSDGPKGRPLVAEFSFRYQAKNEKFIPSVAVSAKAAFDLLQRLDWCRSGATTKTEYVYRTHSNS